MVDDADYRFDDVVDVGEVAFHVAVVVQVDRVAVQDGAGEGEQRHVGPAPGAVHGEEAQAGGRDAEQVRVAVRHQLVGALGGGVQADRMVGGAGLGERNVAVEAVHRTGRGVHQVAHRGLAARFEHAQEAVHVVRRVGERVAERVADAGLRGQVADHVEAVLGAKGAHGLRVCQVEAPEAQSRLGGEGFRTACFAADDPELTQSVQFQLDIVVAVEVVDPEHAVPRLDQAARQVEADETGYSGNENLHESYYGRSGASGQPDNRRFISGRTRVGRPST